MSVHTIYRNKHGQIALKSRYNHYLSLLDAEVQQTYVETRFGRTHVLEIGPSDAQPVIILQGGNCISPMTLQWFSSLFKDYRIIAPDTIGHPGLSDETRVSAQDDSFALWAADLQDHYQIDRCAFIGPSYGGGIILRLAAYMPERIACSILVAPAGVAFGSKIAMIGQVLLPMLSYKLTSSKKALQKIADAMSLGHMSELDKQIIGDIFKHVVLERNMPKIAEKDELQRYTSPTMVIAGRRDIFFSGERVLKQAHAIIPNLQESRIYDMGHFPTAEAKEAMNQDIMQFLSKFYR